MLSRVAVTILALVKVHTFKPVHGPSSKVRVKFFFFGGGCQRGLRGLGLYMVSSGIVRASYEEHWYCILLCAKGFGRILVLWGLVFELWGFQSQRSCFGSCDLGFGLFKGALGMRSSGWGGWVGIQGRRGFDDGEVCVFRGPLLV